MLHTEVRTELEGYDALEEASRSAAMAVGLTPAEVTTAIHNLPPEAASADSELEDVRWFHRDWLVMTLILGTQHSAQQSNKGLGRLVLRAKKFHLI